MQHQLENEKYEEKAEEEKNEKGHETEKKKQGYFRMEEEQQEISREIKALKKYSLPELIKRFERTDLRDLRPIEEAIEKKCSVWLQLRKLPQPIGVWDVFVPIGYKSTLQLEIHFETKEMRHIGSKKSYEPFHVS